ncbi:TIR domain-containing protein [Marinobacterium stanieri]|uniref:Predicted nucleotide-binding protein containing TIR-like domain-containing protein n=1 Tax=Marinobacterium stanieri TaxID=49186 RepID=A0A1N6VQD1_9GAMM|nr:nucleotide-binding protein [Marinobacterium stanieri]SIQ80081.1 Predicted nucleotide-binding protein containing TIR-like domain-containing protein [Marinobacterium stanieri]
MGKPRLFIASSAESLKIAEAVNVNLDHDFEVTIWKNGTFKLSSTAIDDLVEKSSAVDFALFIFAPDDVASIRSRKEHVVRDNVIFEMGLFVGAIGKSRSFILKPRDIDMHLPTDLLGVTPADYNAGRSDGDLVSATNRACSLLKAEADRLGVINHASLSKSQKIIANPANYELKVEDYKILAVCLESHTANPTGQTYSSISNNFRGNNSALTQISLIKLERMGLVDKTIELDEQWGNDYYAYSITELGVDTLLKNEDQLRPRAPVDDFDDEVPF